MISKNDKKEIVRKSGFTDISLVNRGRVLGLYESTSMSIRQIAELVKIRKSSVSQIIRMQKTLGDLTPKRIDKYGRKKVQQPLTKK